MLKEHTSCPDAHPADFTQRGEIRVTRLNKRRAAKENIDGKWYYVRWKGYLLAGDEVASLQNRNIKVWDKNENAVSVACEVQSDDPPTDAQVLRNPNASQSYLSNRSSASPTSAIWDPTVAVKRRKSNHTRPASGIDSQLPQLDDIGGIAKNTPVSLDGHVNRLASKRRFTMQRQSSPETSREQWSAASPDTTIKPENTQPNFHTLSGPRTSQGELNTRALSNADLDHHIAYRHGEERGTSSRIG